MLLAAVATEPPRDQRLERRPVVRLEYVHDDEGRCPDAEAMRAAIAASLGYEPFDEDAPLFVVARIQRRAGGLEAHITLHNRGGEVRGERTLTADGGDCRELAASAAVAIGAAIDALDDDVDREPTPVAQAPPVSVEAPGAVALPVVGLGVGGRAVWSALPELTGAVELGAELRPGSDSWSVGVSGLATAQSASIRTQTGRVHVGLMATSLTGCLRRQELSACAVLSGGRYRASAEGLVHARAVGTAYAAVGARLACDVVVVSWRIRPFAELLAMPTWTELRVSDRTVWRSPTFGASAGASVLLDL